MTSEFKSWTEETDADFLRVITSRFSDEAVPVSRKMLSNPMREYCKSAGDIAYENDVPKCVQGAILRRVYYKQQPMHAVVGGMLAAEKDASPVSLVNVMRKTIQPRGDSVLFFANTACDESYKMNRMLGVKDPVPSSNGVLRIGIIHYLFAARLFLRRKFLKGQQGRNTGALPLVRDWFLKIRDGIVIKRMLSFDKCAYDQFMAEYIKGNDGLVSSRSASELNWMFGDKIGNGSIVVLGLFVSDALCGHIILSSDDGSGQNWKVSDLIAVGNDLGHLEVLLKAARKFLRQKTKAITIRANGFPDYFWKNFDRYFPIKRTLNSGRMLLKITSDTIKEQLSDLANSEDSWYFGPYDGDRALCDGINCVAGNCNRGDDGK